MSIGLNATNFFNALLIHGQLFPIGPPSNGHDINDRFQSRLSPEMIGRKELGGELRLAHHARAATGLAGL
jgi:hypothetical protein